VQLQPLVTSFLEGEGFSYERAGALVRVDGVGQGFTVVVRADDDDAVLTIYAVSTLAVPEERRQAVMELVTRVGFDLRVGSFDLDLDDGELRFRTAVDFEGVEPSVGLLKNAFYTAVATMRRYLPEVAAVVAGRR
jgi:hypothetical protein